MLAHLSQIARVNSTESRIDSKICLISWADEPSKGFVVIHSKRRTGHINLRTPEVKSRFQIARIKSRCKSENHLASRRLSLHRSAYHQSRSINLFSKNRRLVLGNPDSAPVTKIRLSRSTSLSLRHLGVGLPHEPFFTEG